MPLNLETLVEVNARINLLPYVDDRARYGVDEKWAYIDGEGGDCEDYTLTKLDALLTLGWPRSDLKIGLCMTEPPDSGYHAVLIATFEGQDYVLDNRAWTPTRWELVPYTWEKFYLLGERVWRWAA